MIQSVYCPLLHISSMEWHLSLLFRFLKCINQDYINKQKKEKLEKLKLKRDKNDMCGETKRLLKIPYTFIPCTGICIQERFSCLIKKIKQILCAGERVYFTNMQEYKQNTISNGLTY